MGWGEYSDSVTIVAAKVPDQPDAPVTAINNINVRISWVDPHMNSSPVSSYRIFIAN